ncbi:MAG: ATP-grasp fold amidoligase family protein, partial [Bacillota bacterium]|nr:ATP-grasp fold amidoligase family protein [Bacillota bacterium]
MVRIYTYGGRVFNMLTFKKIIDYFKKPRKLIFLLGYKGFLNWLPDKPYLKLVYWGETGKKLNLENPQTFNEKLQWIKLYDRKPEYCIYADKYAVRSYVQEIIGEEYLIPLIAVYNNTDEINWELLPDQFVLKCTHGSGTNII